MTMFWISLASFLSGALIGIIIMAFIVGGTE